MAGIKSCFYSIIIVLFLICFGNNTALGQNQIAIDTVNITGDSVIFIGQSTTLTASQGFKDYTWNTGDTTQSIVVSPVEDTRYWVDAMSINDTLSTDTITVKVNSYIVDHSSSYIIHEPDQPTNLWVILDDGPTPLWSNDSTTSSISVNPTQNTIYTLYVLVDSDTVESLDFNVVLSNNLSFTYDTVCFGNLTTLTNNSIVGDTITNILWDLNGDGLFDDGEGNTVTYLYPIGGYHLTGMRVYFTNNSIKAIYIPVSVGDIPVADITYVGNCVGSVTSLYGNATVEVDSITIWDWDLGDGATSNDELTQHYYDTIASYEVILVTTSNIGCSSSDTTQVLISDAPDVELQTSDGTIVNQDDTVYFQQGQTVTIDIVNFIDFDNFLWDNDDTVSFITLAEEGSYYVEAFKNGCVNSKDFATSWGSTPPQPSGENIMNLITPNADGYNDFWLVNDPDITLPIAVNIYNRSGNLVYTSNEYGNDWDGQYNGNPLPQATYYYIITDASGNTFKGAVTIIR